MHNQPHRAMDPAPAIYIPYRPPPSPKNSPQPFFILHHYLDGTEIRYATIQAGVCVAGVTTWGPEMVVYQQHPEHRTPSPPRSGDRGCLNDLAMQVHSLPGHYGPASPAYLLSVPREPVDTGRAIAPSPPSTYIDASAPMELGGHDIEAGGQAIEPDGQITAPDQTVPTEQPKREPKSIDTMAVESRAAHAKLKQSLSDRYLTRKN